MKTKQPPRLLPSLPNASTASAPSAPHSKTAHRSSAADHAASVRQLCKTYKATTEKLVYAFAALSHEQATTAKSKSVADAMHNSSRKTLLSTITSSLAAGVEQVVVNKNVQSEVLSDLRDRFKLIERPTTADCGTQAVMEASPKRARSPPATFEPKQPPAAVDAKAEEKENLSAVKTARAGPSDAVYDRMKAWHARKTARLDGQAKAKEEEELKRVQLQPRLRPSNAYKHVKSVLQQERHAATAARVAEAEAKKAVFEAKAAKAEATANFEREERTRMQQLMDKAVAMQRQAQEQLAEAQAEQEEAERKLQKLQAKVEREHQERAELAEMELALDGRKLETWPMFASKRVLRVHPSDTFDGRVSSEFRVRDTEGEKGVSFLMGRSVATQLSEVQCVLFDARLFSELQAARWWVENEHRLRAKSHV